MLGGTLTNPYIYSSKAGHIGVRVLKIRDSYLRGGYFEDVDVGYQIGDGSVSPSRSTIELPRFIDVATSVDLQSSTDSTTIYYNLGSGKFAPYKTHNKEQVKKEIGGTTLAHLDTYTTWAELALCIGTVWTDSEAGTFHSDGTTVTILSGTANFAAGSDDGNLNVRISNGRLQIYNRLGSSKEVHWDIKGQVSL
jgi:hypothetical protein